MTYAKPEVRALGKATNAVKGQSSPKDTNVALDANMRDFNVSIAAYEADE